jgi:hypothetical protein
MESCVVSNTAIWDALSKTDPRQTKQFSRAGGFKGTAIKPIWIVKRLTEQFGPVGMEEPSFEVVTVDGEVLVFCKVKCWHTLPGNSFYGVGGDKVVAKRSSGYFNDDEAFKKAYTDAVGNAFKFTGVGADIHMGQFDDSKYVQEVGREFVAAEREAGGQSQTGAVSPRQPWDTPIKNKTALHKAMTALERELAGCGDADMVYAITATQDWRDFVKTAEQHSPHYLRGGEPAPPEFEGLLNTAERLVKEFDSATANHVADLARV